MKIKVLQPEGKEWDGVLTLGEDLLPPLSYSAVRFVIRNT